MSFALAVAAFLLTGTLFGLATHAHRHWFSEGHTRRGAADERDPMQTRLAWTLLCSALWPLMLLTGAFSWWAKRR